MTNATTRTYATKYHATALPRSAMSGRATAPAQSVPGNSIVKSVNIASPYEPKYRAPTHSDEDGAAPLFVAGAGAGAHAPKRSAPSAAKQLMTSNMRRIKLAAPGSARAIEAAIFPSDATRLTAAYVSVHDTGHHRGSQGEPKRGGAGGALRADHLYVVKSLGAAQGCPNLREAKKLVPLNR